MYQPRSSGPYHTVVPSGDATASVPGLLGQVLGITGVGFLITALAAYLFQGVSQGIGLVALIGGLVLIFVMSAVRGNPRVALLWFYAFTFLEGIGLAPTITYYAVTVGPDVVVNAAGTTGFGMLVLGGVALRFLGRLAPLPRDRQRRARRAAHRRADLDLHALGSSDDVFVADPRRVHAADARRLQPHPCRR